MTSTLSLFSGRVLKLRRRTVSPTIEMQNDYQGDHDIAANHGFTDREVAFSLYKFGNDCAKEENWNEALLAWENALAIFEREYGRTNKGVYKVLKKIGFAHLKLGHIALAYDALNEAVTTGKKLQTIKGDDEIEAALKALEPHILRKRTEHAIIGYLDSQEDSHTRQISFGPGSSKTFARSA